MEYNNKKRNGIIIKKKRYMKTTASDKKMINVKAFFTWQLKYYYKYKSKWLRGFGKYIHKRNPPKLSFCIKGGDKNDPLKKV